MSDRKRASSPPIAPLCLLLLLACVFSVALTALTLASAQAFKAPDNTVLVASPSCGWPVEMPPNTKLPPTEMETREMLLAPVKALYEAARNYARSCYAEEGNGLVPGSEPQCDTLVKPRISSILTRDPKCPFPGSKVCKADAAVVESSFIDSRDTLGINTPDEDRISAKKTLTCVPN